MSDLPIQRPWIYDWLTSDAYGYIVYIVAVTACIIHPILLVLHVFHIFMKSNNLDKRTSISSPKHGNDKRMITILIRIVDITTLMAIGFGELSTIITLINHSSVISNSQTCEAITITQNICWIFTKLCIYNVLIIRLQIAFWGSAYEYNRRLMFGASCFVTVVCLICIIGSVIDVDSIYFITGWCLFIIPTWLILLPCVLDVICSLFALYLFIKPLKRTWKDIKLENNVTKQNLAFKVSQLISKLILLTTIAVISNVFSGIFFAVTDIAIGSFLDTLINPICLILMESKHKRLYRVLCKYGHSGIQKMIFGYSESNGLLKLKSTTTLSSIKRDATDNECDTNDIDESPTE